MAAGGVGGDEAEKGVVLRTGADRAGCDEDRNACQVEEGGDKMGEGVKG